MSDATPINVTAFQPFEGGLGKRLSVTTTTARTQIPGTQAVATPDRLRVLISNSGTIPVSICMGQDAVIATLDCQEVLPGTQVLFTPPVVAPDAVWIAAICSSSTTYIQVTAGYGT
jgi:hypothetical protein